MGAAEARRRAVGSGPRRAGIGILILVAMAVAGCAAEPPATAPIAAATAPAVAVAPADAEPAVCAVSFVDDAAPLAVQQQHVGARFAALPIPARAGSVFAGWYTSAAAALSRDAASRVNGAKLVECPDGRLTLHGAWDSPAQFWATGTRVPILMYHTFTTDPDGISGSQRSNTVYTRTFDAQLGYIAREGFYLPTWDELDAFIDGRLALPRRSVIITDDDAAPSWFALGVPLVDEHRLLTTSFVITQSRDWKVPSIWVQQRSHTNDMHRMGANGRGLMVNLPAAAIAADMATSARILGVAQVMAYPFGHVDATAERGLGQAGFQMAVTTVPGYVTPGTNKLELPRMKVAYGMSVQELAAVIG